MKYDVENLNPGTWFDFPDGEGRICLRILSFEEAEDIRKKTVKHGVEYKKNQRFEFDVTDEGKQFELTWDSCIVGWENIQDAKGKDIPCETANKIMLMRGSPSFAHMVNEFLEKLTEIQEQEREIEKKT